MTVKENRRLSWITLHLVVVVGLLVFIALLSLQDQSYVSESAAATLRQALQVTAYGLLGAWIVSMVRLTNYMEASQ